MKYLAAVDNMVPGQNLSAYITSVSGIPVLTAEQEKDLAERLYYQEYILRNWRIVKVATTKAQRKLFFHLRGAKKSLAWLNNDEVNAIAEDLGVDAKVVRQMEGRLSAHDAPFDMGVDDDDESAYQAPANYLEDKRNDPVDLLEQQNWQETSSRQLLEAMGDLDERSKDILNARWLSEQKSTLHDLADKYGISAERIRQLEKNAMKKIKVAMQS